MPRRREPDPPPWAGLSTEARALLLVDAVEPLLEMFAVCDDVFTEEDSLSAQHRQKSLGRLYEQWQKCRLKMDPTFDHRAARRPRRWEPPSARSR